MTYTKDRVGKILIFKASSGLGGGRGGLAQVPEKGGRAGDGIRMEGRAASSGRGGDAEGTGQMQGQTLSLGAQKAPLNPKPGVMPRTASAPRAAIPALVR